MVQKQTIGPDSEREERLQLADVAVGKLTSDLVIEGGTIVDVNLGVLRRADIAVKGERIAFAGDVSYTVGPATRHINACGKHVAPGLIDAHMHFESALVTPRALAEAVLPRGNTAWVAEPHDWANIFGLAGMEMLQAEAARLLVRFYMVAPSLVPLIGAADGTTRGSLYPEDIQRMMGWSQVLGLGKAWGPSILARDPVQLAKLQAAYAEGKTLGGRFDYMTKQEVQGAVGAGIGDTYTVDSWHAPEDILELLQDGLRTIASAGSSVSHTAPLAKMLKEQRVDTRHLMLCTYDRFPGDVIERGTIDDAVRSLTSQGVDPIVAIQMGTLNTAEYFGLGSQVGSIAPGRLADLVILDDLADFRARSVFVGGKLVAEGGKMVAVSPASSFPDWTRKMVTLPAGFGVEALKYPTALQEGKVRVRAIGLIAGQITHDRTREDIVEVPVCHGEILADPKQDVLKLVAIDRFGITGQIGRGFIRGTGLRQGAIAGTLAHDLGCIMAAGVTDEDIVFAVQRLAATGGGLVVTAGDKVLAELPLEIGGLVTDRSVSEVAAEAELLEQAVERLGHNLHLPQGLLRNLGFITLPPTADAPLRITDAGYLRLPATDGPSDGSFAMDHASVALSDLTPATSSGSM